jgi:hypothetical protein
LLAQEHCVFVNRKQTHLILEKGPTSACLAEL